MCSSDDTVFYNFVWKKKKKLGLELLLFFLFIAITSKVRVISIVLEQETC